MANAWFRMYAEFANDPKVQMLSEVAHRVAEIAHRQAEARRYCYPDWRAVERESGLCGDAFMSAFEELCASGVVFSGFPSLLVALADAWPLAPMFGPTQSARPSAEVWRKIRRSIFERDGFTCQYCGAKGVRLECDHVVPVALGGGHDDENLITACIRCNRSKGAKTLSAWRAA